MAKEIKKTNNNQPKRGKGFSNLLVFLVFY
jgi:hypothetical protein